MTDDFTVRTEKQVGQPLVFKREEFLNGYEMKTLIPPKTDIVPETEQKSIDFSNNCPF
jgi:hypothetical protein